MTVNDDVFQKTYREWLQQALARDAQQWAEVEQELNRLREKLRAIAERPSR
jgi:hypothetical protein